MRARIKEKWEVAKGTLLVSFDLLGEEVEFSPGQYFFVTLPDIGYQDGKGLRRHITVVTSPNEKGVLGFATRMRDSAFKRSLRDLPVGAEVEVESPKGNFVLPENASRPLVFVAGGIGITVFRSMLRYIREERLPYRVTLIYSNRDRESTAFLDELRELAGQDGKLTFVPTMSGLDATEPWDGERGRIDASMLARHLDGVSDAIYYLTGPPGMVHGLRTMLIDDGVDEDDIRTEEFTGY